MSKLEPHVQRMADEQGELEERLEKLSAFIESNPVFKTLSETDQYLLLAQLTAMATYSNILNLRIKLA